VEARPRHCQKNARVGIGITVGTVKSNVVHRAACAARRSREECVDVKLIDRYVSRELLITSILGVAVLSIVLVLGNVFKELLNLLVNHNVPLEFILSFIAYILPFSLTFTIPWGFLTAVLLVFGKMSAENELIALRSNGISIPRVCVAAFVMAFVFVGICLWINVDVAPKAQVKMKDALYNIATSNPLAMFGSDKIIDEFPGRKIYVERNEGARLHNILVYEVNEADEPMRVVHAQTGLINADHANNQLLLHLFDARFEERDANDPGDLNKIHQGIIATETTFPISLQELYEKNKRKKGFGAMTNRELLERINQEKTVSVAKEDRKKAAAVRSAARTEVSKRFSCSLASFAFALIGIPLAITAHRRETSIGFLLSLIVAFVYFFFIIMVDIVRTNPRLYPEFLIWFPNVLFIALGAILFRRLSRV
jgi:lipopolysaccharide export system permease protein